MRYTKKDRIYILTEDGITNIIYSIDKLEKAEQIVAEMSECHQREFTLKIINEYVDSMGYGHYQLHTLIRAEKHYANQQLG